MRILGVFAAPTLAAPPAAARPSEAVGAIEAVVLHQAVQLGYNGFVSYVPEPVVLFKSGDALTDMTGLGDPDGLAANKRRNPKHWTTWRRAGATLEIREGTRWSRPTAELRGLPRHTRLAGRFETEAYAGTSTGAAAATWGTLELDADGRFSTDRGGGTHSASHASSSQSATTGGSYDITGYAITLRHDDGRVETLPIIFSLQRDMFWLDGAAYLRR